MAEESRHARLEIPTVSSLGHAMVFTAAEAGRRDRHSQGTEVPTVLQPQASRGRSSGEFAPGCRENRDRSQSASETSVLGSARKELSFQTRGVWVSSWKGHPSLAIVGGQRLSFKVDVGTENQLAGR